MTQIKTLIVDDDFISRKILKNILNEFGEVDIASDGEEAIMAYQDSINDGEQYHLIMLDILMDGMNGLEVLTKIREIEERKNINGSDGVKIIMSSSLSDPKTIMESFRKQSEGYIVKPVEKDKIIEKMEALNLI